MSEVINEINESGIMTIKLNRPESLNSLNYGLVTGVIEAFNEAASNESVRAVILTGEGRGFCSGADLSGEVGRQNQNGLLVKFQQKTWNFI